MMKYTLHQILLISILFFALPTNAQVELYCEDFEQWLVGTGFVQDENDSTIYAFYDLYGPVNDSVRWINLLDDDFADIILATPQSFPHNGVYPIDISPTNEGLAISLYNLFRSTGTSFELPKYDFTKKGKITFDILLNLGSISMDSLIISFDSGQDSWEYILYNNQNVDLAESISIDIPILDHDIDIDTLTISLTKEAASSNNSTYIIDNLCVSQNELTSINGKFEENSVFITPSIIESGGELVIKQFNIPGRKTYTIWSSVGQKLYEMNDPNSSEIVILPVGKWASGMYYVQIQNEFGLTMARPFLVAHKS